MLIEVNDITARALIALGQAKEVKPVAAEPVLSWPRVVTVPTPWGLDVKVKLSEPVTALWYPGLMASIVGQNGVLNEPSNGGDAVPPLPLRSEAGFPLFYALAGGKPIDTASVCVGDQTFNSDAAAKDYLARSATPGTGGTRTGTPVPHADDKPLDPVLISEWIKVQSAGDDGAAGRWLNQRGTEVARRLLNEGYMSHAQSAAYDAAAGGYK